MQHGGAREGEEKLRDFSYSANPYRPPFVKRALERAKIERYPYCNERLENDIKNKLGIPQDVVITAGITEQIQIINAQPIVPIPHGSLISLNLSASGLEVIAYPILIPERL